MLIDHPSSFGRFVSGVTSTLLTNSPAASGVLGSIRSDPNVLQSDLATCHLKYAVTEAALRRPAVSTSRVHEGVRLKPAWLV